jgi:hypothetical protein
VTPNRHRPLNLFYSYAREDLSLRIALERHLAVLQRQGVIAGWHDQEISAGAEWAGEVDEHLRTADIILLLISSDFLSSDYCYDVELQRAMQRHDAGAARVIPVLLRAVEWKGAPFGKLQAVPTGAVPVTSWDNRDEAFADIAGAIRRAATELLACKEKAQSATSETGPVGTVLGFFPQQQEFIQEHALAVVGREYVLTAIDAFIATRPRGFFIIQAGPGLGKSSIAAKLALERGWPHHFIGRTGRRGDSGLILTSLLAQLEPGSEQQKTGSRSIEELVDRFEHALRRRAEGGSPVVVLVDALNELPVESPDDPPFLLTETLPRHTYFVVTSQPGARLDRLQEQLATIPAQAYTLRPLLPQEIERTIRARRPAAGDALVDRLAVASAGNPLYLRASLDAIEAGGNLPLDQLPDAVEGYFRRATRDIAAQPLLRELLALIAICRKNLTVRELSEITGASQRALHLKAIHPIRPFLLQLGDTYSFFHERFHDFILTELLYEDELRGYHRQLADWLSSPEGRARDYYWTSYVHHLFHAGDLGAVQDHIDERFLADKLRRFGYAVLEDLELLGKTLLQSGDPAFVERTVARLDALREVVGSDVVDEVARNVQPTQSLARSRAGAMAPTFPSVPGIDLDAVLIPKRVVTADFIEVVPKEGRLVLTIGDAPATGLKSAFVARFIATLFRSFVMSPGAPTMGRLLSQVAETISRHSYFERVSMQCLDVDVAGGVVSMASAGHPYPVLYSSRYGRCDRLPVRGPLLQARQVSDEKHRPYELRHAEIGPGDTMVLVSDGVIEAGPIANPYGYRFGAIVERHAGHSARTIANAILSDWRVHLDGEAPADDAAILVLTVVDQPIQGKS